MAITQSWGYAGDVNAPEWAQLIPFAGGVQYGVKDFASWRPTIGGPGDRAVTIDAGLGWGHGVMDVNDAPVTLNLAAGDRWDLIVARRVWAAGETTFEVVQGGASKALPGRLNVPGTEDEQPLALVRVQGAVVTELVDLRCVPGDGGILAFDTAALQYLDRVGTQVRIGDVLSTRGVSSLGSPEWLQADVGDTGWINAPAPINGFGSASGDEFQARYRRLNGVVYLRGSIRRSTAPGNFLTAFSLPAGFRPGYPVWSMQREGVTVAVLSSGAVQISAVGAAPSGTAYVLGGICFPVG